MPDQWQLPVGQFQRNLLIQSRIVKADTRRIVAVTGKENGFDTRPPDCTQAHRTGFAAGVDHGTLQGKIPNVSAGIADRDDLAPDNQRVLVINNVIRDVAEILRGAGRGQ